MSLSDKTALVVGLGGLGCPAAWVLARAGVGRLVLVDDDVVDVTNLHRQVLYCDADIGAHKLDAARRKLRELGPSEIVVHKTRLLPENARDLVRQADVVIEGADNFATKFLAADACHLERKPVVHGAGVRLHGTVLSVRPGGAPCYRCLFEDVLDGDAAPNCAEAGVLGPVVGLLGALMADLALDLLQGDEQRTAVLHGYDAECDRLRPVVLHARRDCPLCGHEPSIQALDEARYFEPSCAAPSQFLH
jgi:adenylyltransferase/sulfurtransferase